MAIDDTYLLGCMGAIPTRTISVRASSNVAATNDNDPKRRLFMENHPLDASCLTLLSFSSGLDPYQEKNEQEATSSRPQLRNAQQARRGRRIIKEQHLLLL